MKQERKRNLFQLAAAVLVNGYALGFARGSVFSGRTKAICVPVLNCYSCPGALGACPMGALQAALGGAGGTMPFYVLGSLMLFAIVLGRLVCGLLCPFGFIQDLLHKIPLPKLRVPKELDRALRYLKYAVLGIMVVLLPMVLTDQFGLAPPYFCKWLCPAGTLEGGIPLVIANAGLRAQLGGLFSWKLVVMAAILALSVFIYRPFCKYLCPLGAFYALFNRFSLYQLRVDDDKCIGCGKCEKTCPMAVDMPKKPASGECIRCGACASACPTGAISRGFRDPGKGKLTGKSGRLNKSGPQDGPQ